MNRIRCAAWLLLLLLLASCSRPATPWLDRAREAYDEVWERYRIPSEGLFSEYYPDSHEANLTYFDDGVKPSRRVSYLWPMSGLVSSTVQLARADRRYLPYLDTMLTAMEQYYDTLRLPFAYQACPSRLDRVDRYYDDNGLVGIDYIDAYGITRNPAHLEKAKQILSFILSGWDDRFEGGVPWLEGHPDQKPACSNGKAMVLALKLYRVTGDPYYLHTGERFYRWIRKYLRDPEHDIIMNAWLTEGEEHAQPDPYTYNTGTFIQGAVALYRFTGNPFYREDALRFSEGSARYFFHFREDGTPYTDNIPWFDVVLLRGYQEVYELTGERSYADLAIRALDAASRDATTPKWLLDAACMPEFMVRAALVNHEIR